MISVHETLVHRVQSANIPTESFFVFWDVAVQFIHVDIGKYRAYTWPLRGSRVCPVILPLLHVPCFQHFPYELDKRFVSDTFAEYFYHNLMAETVKTRLNISFYKPFCTGIFPLYSVECCVTAPLGPKTVRCFRECRFIDAFQYHSDYFLHKLVVPGWNAKWPLLCRIVLFGYVCAAGRSWAICAVSYRCNNTVYPFETHSVNGYTVNSRRHTAVIRIYVFICQQVELRIV